MFQFIDIPVQAFIKKYLFTMNFDKEQNSFEKSVMVSKHAIISVVEDLDKNDLKDLSICFSMKNFMNFLYLQ